MVSNTSRLRSIVLTTLIITFFSALTLFLIFYIQGKTINDKGEIVETGVIRINSIPEDVKVFIDGEEVSKRGDIVRSIKFGEREISIEKEDFTVWTKNILVNTTEVKEIYVQLYPIESKFTQLSDLNIDKIVYSNDMDYAFFTVITSELSSEIGLWKYKLNNNLLDLNREQKPEKLASFTEPEIEDLKSNDYSILISRDKDKVIINSISNFLNKVYETQEFNTGKDLSKIIGFNPKSVKWLQSSKSLLINDENVLYEFFLEDNKKYLVNYYPETTNVPFCITQDSVYYFDATKDQIFLYRNSESTAINLNTTLDNIITLHCSNDNKDKIIIETLEGFKYVNLEENFIDDVDGSISIINISNDGNSVLYKDGEQIYSYNVELTTTETKFISKKTLIEKPDIDIINFSNTSRNLIISYKSTELQEQKLEIADRDGFNEYNLIENDSYYLDSIAIKNDSKELYIVLNNSIGDQNASDNFNLYKIVLEE
jgi:hypothetical protein